MIRIMDRTSRDRNQTTIEPRWFGESWANVANVSPKYLVATIVAAMHLKNLDAWRNAEPYRANGYSNLLGVLIDLDGRPKCRARL